jgi:uroporphyrinogen-III decarboxylase
MMGALLEAWRRIWEAQQDRPHWMPSQGGGSRTAHDGSRVVVTADQCLWYPPGAAEPAVDYDAFFDNRHGDVFRTDGPQSIAEVDQAAPVWPASSWAGDGHEVLHDLVQARFGQDHMVHGGGGSPFWHGYSLWGFAGYMELLRDRPELVHRVCQRHLESTLKGARAAWGFGLRAIFIEECFTGSDLISPRDFADLAWPYTRDLLTGLKAIGFQVVFYLTGGVEGRLPYLAECAADALAFEESKKSFVIDLKRIRREIGPEKVLFGNVDVVLVRDGSEAQIRAEVERQYEAAGPRYVVSIGSPLTLDTTPDKLEMLVRSARGLR